MITSASNKIRLLLMKNVCMSPELSLENTILNISQEFVIVYFNTAPLVYGNTR